MKLYRLKIGKSEIHIASDSFDEALDSGIQVYLKKEANRFIACNTGEIKKLISSLSVVCDIDVITKH